VEADLLDQELSDQDRVLLLFAYLGPLSFVTLVASRREFVKWHAKQGLVLAGTAVVVYPVLRFVHYVLDRYFPTVFAEMFRVGIWMVLLGVFVTMALCIVRGLEGERFRVPLVGDLADHL
jgi:uncharacterized membrane protein